MKKLFLFIIILSQVSFSQYRIKAPLYLYKSQTAPDTFTARILMGALTTARNFSLPNVSGTFALLDGGQTFTSAIWQGTSIDTAYTNAVSKITSATSLLTATKQAKDYRFYLDTLTRSLSITTDNDRILDSLKVLTELEDTTLLSPFLAVKTQSNTFATGTTQTMANAVLDTLTFTPYDFHLQSYAISGFEYLELRANQNYGTVFTVRNDSDGTQAATVSEIQAANGAGLWHGMQISAFSPSYSAVTFGADAPGNTLICNFGDAPSGKGDLLLAQRFNKSLKFYAGGNPSSATLWMEITPFGKVIVYDSLSVSNVLSVTGTGAHSIASAGSGVTFYRDGGGQFTAFDTYGNTNGSTMAGEAYAGTKASPTQIAASQVLASFSGRGYINGSTRNQGAMQFLAKSTPSATNYGSFARLTLVPDSSTTVTTHSIFDWVLQSPRTTLGGSTAGAGDGLIFLGDSGYIVSTQIWDASRNFFNLGAITATGAITTTDKGVIEDSLRVGTSTPAKMNNNGSFTGLNLSRFDSLTTNKIIFSGVAPPTQPYAFGADSTNRRLLYTSYYVQRSVDLTHGVITSDVLDSNSVRETVLDSVQMAANFPSVGKIVVINLLGNFTLTGAGTCIIRIRYRDGATSDTTGTVLDSLILTNIASDKGLEIEATTTFRTVGATGSAVSFIKARTGTTVVEGGNVLGAVTINTTSSNTLLITSKRSVMSDKVKIRQGWAETKN